MKGGNNSRDIMLANISIRPTMAISNTLSLKRKYSANPADKINITALDAL